MSFFSDLTSGNFGNLGHDITAQVEDHPWQTLGYVGAGLGTALTAGLAGPELFGALGAAEGGAAALGGEAAAEGGLAGLTAAEAAPESALAFAGPGGLQGAEGVGAINTALGAPGGAGAAGGLGADLGVSVPGEAALAGQADAAVTGSSQTGFLNSLWEGAKSSVAKNPLGIGAAGVGLGMNLLRGNPTDPNQQKLQQQAADLGAQGDQLRQYLANGTLPPAMAASLKNATDAAKARIISNHAAAGRPTDPSQNSALAQELNQVDMNGVAAMADAQLNMMKTGLNETGLSTQLYEMLVKMDRQNNQDLMNAISNFAAALGGGSKGVQLNLARA